MLSTNLPRSLLVIGILWTSLLVTSSASGLTIDDRVISASVTIEHEGPTERQLAMSKFIQGVGRDVTSPSFLVASRAAEATEGLFAGRGPFLKLVGMLVGLVVFCIVSRIFES